jgi:very-short-patch-repair endonuclease
MTKPERVLWRAIRQALPGHHWRKQVPLGAYYADFASHSAKLVIELDGGQHATALARDAKRTRFLEGEGFRVLRFWNNDVLSNIDGVLHSIAQSLSRREREEAAKRRKGEVEAAPSPSHAAGAGPSLSQRRGLQ